MSIYVDKASSILTDIGWQLQPPYRFSQ